MIPSYFIDDASLFHGTSSVNMTGGGLGGLVKLATVPAHQQGLEYNMSRVLVHSVLLMSFAIELWR